MAEARGVRSACGRARCRIRRAWRGAAAVAPLRPGAPERLGSHSACHPADRHRLLLRLAARQRVRRVLRPRLGRARLLDARLHPQQPQRAVPAGDRRPPGADRDGARPCLHHRCPQLGPEVARDAAPAQPGRADPGRTAPDRRRSGRVRPLPVQHAVPGRDAVSRRGRAAHRARRPPARAAPRRSAAVDGRTRLRRPVRRGLPLLDRGPLRAETRARRGGERREPPRRAARRDVLDRLQTRVARSRTDLRLGVRL